MGKGKSRYLWTYHGDEIVQQVRLSDCHTQDSTLRGMHDVHMKMIYANHKHEAQLQPSYEKRAKATHSTTVDNGHTSARCLA